MTDSTLATILVVAWAASTLVGVLVVAPAAATRAFQARMSSLEVRLRLAVHDGALPGLGPGFNLAEQAALLRLLAADLPLSLLRVKVPRDDSTESRRREWQEFRQSPTVPRLDTYTGIREEFVKAFDRHLRSRGPIGWLAFLRLWMLAHREGVPLTDETAQQVVPRLPSVGV